METNGSADGRRRSRPTAAIIALVVLVVATAAVVTATWRTTPDTGVLTTQDASSAPDSGTGRYVAVVDGDEEVSVVRFTGGDETTVYDPDGDALKSATTVDVHPDGRTVVVSARRLDDCGRVLRTTVDGAPPEDLGVDGGAAVVRPDGAAIAYIPMERDSQGRCSPVGIAVRDLTTGEERRWDRGAGGPPDFTGFYELAWHPDGDELAFVVGSEESGLQLRVLDTTRRGTALAARRVVPPRDAETWSQPSFGSDGLYVVAACCRDTAEATRLVRVRLQGERANSDTAYTFTSDVHQADFDPTTGELVYVTTDGAAYAVDVGTGDEPRPLAASVQLAFL